LLITEALINFLDEVTMKIRSFLLILIIASLFAGMVNAQTGAAKGRGRVKGTLTDQDGKPVADATVKFTSERLQTSFEVKTDGKGEWVANGIAGGNWNIDLIKDGYETKQISYHIQQSGYNKPVILSIQRMAKAPAAPGTTGQPGQPGQKQAPQDPSRVLIMEGSALADKKDYAGAIAKYEQAIQMKPELHALYGEIGNLYMLMGNSDKALEAYNKHLEKDPANMDARLSAVAILFDKKDVAGAKKMLETLDLKVVTNPNALYNVGVGFYNAQETQEAIKYWEKVIELDPKMIDAYFQLGAAYLSIKDNPKSKAMFEKVIELDPASESAKMAKEMLETMK
jgi:Tfp pilus assembly protein PilF